MPLARSLDLPNPPIDDVFVQLLLTALELDLTISVADLGQVCRNTPSGDPMMAMMSALLRLPRLDLGQRARPRRAHLAVWAAFVVFTIVFAGDDPAARRDERGRVGVPA
ncbi:hypothetical protein [Sorangium sp. So ce1335]|uniref:hypothetical protein n=1 Tax=Sorangium sp. So ce1335 TaxID=3133335 RepID=UPI003F5F903E